MVYESLECVSFTSKIDNKHISHSLKLSLVHLKQKLEIFRQLICLEGQK